MVQWRGGRYFYLRVITENQKRVLRRHRKVLFGDESLRRFDSFDLDAIFAASTLRVVDMLYSHRRAGFTSCDEYYRWSSSRHYMHRVSDMH